MHLFFVDRMRSGGRTVAALASAARWIWRMGGVGCVATQVLSAQVVPGEGAQIGSLAADRARLREISGQAALSPPPDTARESTRYLPPTLRLAWNSDLPSGGNDGDLWAGRGANASITAGIALRRDWFGHAVDIVVAPTLAHSRNLPFLVLPGRAPGRSAFSSPWHVPPNSADLPLRFGDLPVTTIGTGQSAITVTSTRVAFGASSTNEWWGPAIRNTLLLGNNAAGVPRLFARSSRPVRTRLGDLEGRAFIGALSESPYFDEAHENDVRALNGLLVTFRPTLDTGLTIGFSRLVISTVPSVVGTLPHALDVLFRYEPIRAYADSQSTDQLTSLFARWVFPTSGFETYVEWARMELPRSIRELLEVPQSTQGYTLGLQWANPVQRGGFLRVQGEATYLEQTQVIADRPTVDFFTGRAAQQGFTQRGQLLGAAVGPGGSSQFIAMDWIEPAWQIGAIVKRARIENDALYREFPARDTQHDVELQMGLRGGARYRTMDVLGELTMGKRYNYLFRSDYYLFGPVNAIDVPNTTLVFTITPR